MTTRSSYKISVIVPVYNIEQYLSECIDSITEQTVGFEKNVQIVLVNDGSSDGSGAICADYQAKYPHNIDFIDKKNGGVSSARNAGIRAAKGKYIAFLDGDDKYDAEYLKEMLDFLQTHRRLPFVAARVKFFDASNNYHVSDYKFSRTRVIDLDETPDAIVSLISSLLFRREAVDGVKFDVKMTHNEDAKFIDSVLMSWGKYMYGAVREAVYFYRKRQSETSATDTAKDRASFYYSTIRYSKFLVTTKNKRTDGKEPHFIQYHALYHYKWRTIQTKKPHILSHDEWVEYKDAVLSGIREVDDEVIVRGSSNLGLGDKIMYLYVKYHHNRKQLKELLSHSEIGQDLLGEASFIVNTINYQKSDGIVIEGRLPMLNTDMFGAKIAVSLNGKRVDHERFNVAHNIFDEIITEPAGYRIILPNGAKGTLRIELVRRDGTKRSLEIVYEQQARISMRRYDYRVIKNTILLLPNPDSLVVTDFKLPKIIIREALLFIQNLLVNKYSIEHNFLKTIAVELVRLAALIKISKGPSGIWLFSDRSISGGDNSEVLFRYVADKSDIRVKPYYVINQDTHSYSELKRAGYMVVKFKSLQHLYLSIICDVMLPSHMDAMYLYPWQGVWHKYCGLMQYEIAHTQHGIVLNDMSNYVGKRAKNASVFLSVCEWEQNHILNGDYGYSKQQVPVTGLPRFDELRDSSKSQRIVTIHPTWRSWLSAESKDGARSISDKFSSSQYYLFYQNLINDTRIVGALERNNYTLRYYMHPNHYANRRDMSSSNSRVEIMDFPYDYNKMFSESKLFITDYSNTLFDFAYLRKPVIHAQFDYDEFFNKHASISKQLFDYQDDGFGPVLYDYESTVKTIVKYLDNDTTLDDKYRKRIDRFFTYSDRNNSRRAYKIILNYVLGNKP